METVLHSWFAQVGLHIHINVEGSDLPCEDFAHSPEHGPNLVQTESKHTTYDLCRFVFVMFWLRGATHHAVSLRSLAPRLRAHVPAQCRTLLRCVLGTSPLYETEPGSAAKKKVLRFLPRNSADCLKEQLEPYGTLLLFPKNWNP